MTYLKVKDHSGASGIDENTIWVGNTESERHTLMIIRLNPKKTECGDVD
jgi:hypothetical protein